MIEENTQVRKRSYFIRNVRKFGFLEYMLRETQIFLKQVKNLFDFPEKVSIRLEVLKQLHNSKCHIN